MRVGIAGPTYINTGVIEFTAKSDVGATARAQVRQEGCLTPKAPNRDQLDPPRCSRRRHRAAGGFYSAPSSSVVSNHTALYPTNTHTRPRESLRALVWHLRHHAKTQGGKSVAERPFFLQNTSTHERPFFLLNTSTHERPFFLLNTSTHPLIYSRALHQTIATPNRSTPATQVLYGVLHQTTQL